MYFKYKMRKIPREYENPFDNICYDLAEWTSPFYKSLNMTPNHLTTVSLVTGLASAYFLYKGDTCLAVSLFLISYYFDCADGLYARKYKMTSKYGDIYDHTCDAIKGIVMLSVMFTLSKDKFYKWLPVIILFFVLSSIHFGCQETHYSGKSKDEQPIMDLYKMLCPDKSYIKWTRFFGAGTQTLVWCLIMSDF